MRDYDELVKALRMCDGDVGACRKCPRYGTDDCHGVFGEAADAIEDLLAAVPKWISVEERLPEIGRTVLTSDGVDVWTNWRLRVGNKGVVEIQWAYNVEEVTHWMPLPEPPKEVLPNGDV